MYEEVVKDSTVRTMPAVKGYKILIAMPKVSDKRESGVFRTDTEVKQEELAAILGSVVAMGDVCYSDEKRFPTGPWCAVGDWVMFRPYSGTRFKIRGQEFRLINDDTIEAVVDDPREYSRAY